MARSPGRRSDLAARLGREVGAPLIRAYSPTGRRFSFAQFAREIAGEADLDECIDDRAEGIGFVCRARTQSSAPLGRAVLALLACLAGQRPADVGLHDGQIVIELPALLHFFIVYLNRQAEANESVRGLSV